MSQTPAPYYVQVRTYLNTQFIYISHIDYPGNSHRFNGSIEQAELEAQRLNGKVAARLLANA